VACIVGFGGDRALEILDGPTVEHRSRTGPRQDNPSLR
jgi:hypothetical protein